MRAIFVRAHKSTHVGRISHQRAYSTYQLLQLLHAPPLYQSLRANSYL